MGKQMFFAGILAVCGGILLGADAETGSVSVDFSKAEGAVKPLHGVDNAPMTLNGITPGFKDAGIPFMRTHDTAYAFGGTHYIDIPNIFPDFDADETKQESYDFAFTDAYLSSVVKAGTKIFYRLGVTIENNYKIKAYRIQPPKDFAKWARICEHVVRHCNEGWANGHHWNIEYWEIWNEPENPPMWTGTRQQFYEFYRVAANHLKKTFPNLKIGGYASCGFYAVNRKDADDFRKGFVTYFTDFLKFITAPETSAPLDFFSWHLYWSDPNEIAVHSNYVDEQLKKAGLAKTENIFNEWNYMEGTKGMNTWDAMKEMPGAAACAAAFCVMQRTGIGKAMYYDACPTRCYCGLYYFPSQRVTPTYRAFQAFNELYRLGTAVACAAGGKEIYALAAKNAQGEGKIMVVNRSGEPAALKVDVSGIQGVPSCRLLSSQKPEIIAAPAIFANSKLSLPPLSIALLSYK